MKLLAAAALISLMAITMTAEDKPGQSPADRIFVNGNIWPGAGLPHAQAIAIKGERIVAVGSDAEIRKLKGGKTEVVDLGGQFVMPGFNDAHLHLSGGGFVHLQVDLVGSKSLAEMQQRIANKVKTSAPSEWIQGRGWDHTIWASQKLPTRQDVDAVTGDHPAIFKRVDGHIAVVNSAALKAAGITRETKDPQTGRIDRDANGEPTGILREDGAMGLVEAKIPPPSLASRRKALEIALGEAAEWGLTSVQSQLLNNTDWDDFLVSEDMEREGKLTARVTWWLPFDAPLEKLQQWRAHHPSSDTMLHTGMLKGYMDGSLGSRTAALRDPYSDEPANKGLALWEPGKLNQMAAERVGAGFQLGFHAIGDRGADLALEAFADAERYAREHATGTARRKDFRPRIEHDQVLEPDQFARYKELGVIASVQPNHLLTDMHWAASRIGDQRAKTSYPWRDFLKNGVVLAFGTDYPVEPITPFRGVYAAVTRKNEEGTAEYHPEQKLTIDEALTAYTMGAAYADFAENDKGTLKAGMLADFVVLDRDLTKVAPKEILGTKVLRTVVGGKTVYPRVQGKVDVPLNR